MYTGSAASRVLMTSRGVCVYPSLCAYVICIHAGSVALREEKGEVAGYVQVHM